MRPLFATLALVIFGGAAYAEYSFIQALGPTTPYNTVVGLACVALLGLAGLGTAVSELVRAPETEAVEG